MNQPAQAKVFANKLIKNHKNTFDLLISGKSTLVYRTELLIEEYGSPNSHGYYEIDGLAALFLLKRSETDLFKKRVNIYYLIFIPWLFRARSVSYKSNFIEFLNFTVN